ncbi:hypothetical protein Prum_030470 [Phytohabitans rumicis]|uniref:HAF repeat-containing protein n=2 Tax=Phytohabitans rumicis TaxID=1076125 RepID=A0A6V8L9M1_9ACTN|nr:hypothetical protein Prum_030470 [Phytohabitans rumicis]
MLPVVIVAGALVVAPETASATVVKRSAALAVNNLTEAAGWSTVDSGAVHAAVWRRGGVSDLGTLGGAESKATAINDRGEVVGSSQTATGVWRAFRWTEAAGMTELDVLSGANNCYANDVNILGQVVGYCIVGSSARPVLWSGGSVTDVDPSTIGNADMEGAAYSINDRGEIFGRQSIYLFVYAGGVRSQIGGTNIYATDRFGAINVRAEIVANAMASGFDTRARLWKGYYPGDPTGYYERFDLALLPGGTDSRVYDINASGESAGWSYSSVGSRAVLWNSDGAAQDLGHLGGAYSEGYGTNDRSEVVGTSSIASGEDHAFLWSGGTMTDLGTL